MWQNTHEPHRTHIQEWSAKISLRSLSLSIVRVHGFVDRQVASANCLDQILGATFGEARVAHVVGEGAQFLIVRRLGDLTVDLLDRGLGVLCGGFAAPGVADRASAQVVGGVAGEALDPKITVVQGAGDGQAGVLLIRHDHNLATVAFGVKRFVDNL